MPSSQALYNPLRRARCSLFFCSSSTTTTTAPHDNASEIEMTSYQRELDPYTAKAENDDLTPQQKIEGLHAIVKKVKTGMFTTHTAGGHLHTRAMVPAGRMSRRSRFIRARNDDPAAFGPTQVNLVFIANKASHKFEEIENDSHVNVSFYDEQTTNWASYCGVARVSQDKDLITKHWNPMCVV